MTCVITPDRLQGGFRREAFEDRVLSPAQAPIRTPLGDDAQSL